jgi:L-alanine-DL-glutamate epimerase-like enolase superfamily enzyme
VKSTDVRIRSAAFAFEDFTYRTPIKFGGTAVDRVTLVNVKLTVETRAGNHALGFGSMPLGNVWAFPSRVLKYDDTLRLMKEAVERINGIVNDWRESGHPIDLGLAIEKEYLPKPAGESASLRGGEPREPVPALALLVCGSPFDAALHDAFGKVHGLNCYHTYGPDFMNHDLGHYLGPDFKGRDLQSYVLREPAPKLPLYHLVGALDPLEAGDLTSPIGDGLPETLEEWVPCNGLTHMKIKLNGDNLDWDVERVVRVNRVAERAQAKRGVTRWFYSLYFNERCPHVGYLLEFLRTVETQTPGGFGRIQYIEQPTARDLKANRQNVMHEAAKIRPIVIDESLVDQESLNVAHEMGYTGAAFKACKGQGHSLLLAAAAQELGMFLCVQDLTCPGASLIHSAGLAAHIPGVAAIESNARQYCPAANQPWEKAFPGIFRITDGTMATETLTGWGLGAVP